MREIRDEIQHWLARDDRVALATVVATRRSAPRPIGAKLAISLRGELAGSVSGGCVENEVYEEAREGLPCGGEIDVFVYEVRKPLIERLLQVVERDERTVVLNLRSPDLAGSTSGHKRPRRRRSRSSPRSWPPEPDAQAGACARQDPYSR